MIRVIQKKSYAKKRSEDYKFQRRIKFFYTRLLKILQLILAISVIAALVWTFKYDGDKKISEFSYQKATDLFISLGLQVKSVEIEGNKVVPTDTILQKIFESLGDVSEKSLILLDLEKLDADLKSIGWIESVSIKKKFPSKVIINIIERTPKIIWQNKGEIWLADDNGELLTQKVERKYIYLPIILGGDAKKDIPKVLQIINSSEKLAKLFVGATKIGNRRWDITLKNNIKIKLPEENPEKAWRKLEEIENKNNILSKKINYIDMRIEGQLVTGLESNNELIENKKSIQLQKTE